MSDGDPTRPLRPAFGREEPTLVNDTLDEVANGLPLGNDALRTRLGGSREEVRAVLSRVADALDGVWA